MLVWVFGFEFLACVRVAGFVVVGLSDCFACGIKFECAFLVGLLVVGFAGLRVVLFLVLFWVIVLGGFDCG